MRRRWKTKQSLFMLDSYITEYGTVGYGKFPHFFVSGTNEDFFFRYFLEALGLELEHKRRDRDNYIKISPESIPIWFNYFIKKEEEWPPRNSFYPPYSPLSATHWHAGEFPLGVNPSLEILCCNKHHGEKSIYADIDRINAVYHLLSKDITATKEVRDSSTNVVKTVEYVVRRGTPVCTMHGYPSSDNELCIKTFRV